MENLVIVDNMVSEKKSSAKKLLNFCFCWWNLGIVHGHFSVFRVTTLTYHRPRFTNTSFLHTVYFSCHDHVGTNCRHCTMQISLS